MRKVLASVGAVALMAALAACSSSGTTPSAAGSGSAAASGKELTISIVVKGKNTYWALAESGARQAGKDLGVNINFNAPDTENEPDKQLNMLTTAINDHSDGIGFSPQDGAQASAPEILQKAKDANIPVVIFDNPLSEQSDVPLTTLSSDNKGMGAQLAEQLTKLIGGKGKVALVTNGLTGNGGIRRDGFLDWVKQNAPDVQVVDVQNGEADQAISADKAQAILQAHPDLAGLAGTGVDATVAIGDMISQLKSKAVGVGIDASPDTLTQISEGKLAGLVTQNPYQMGYKTVQMLVDAIKGNPPTEKTMVSESVWVDKSNMNNDDIKKVLGTN
jgi:ribose transport system substrate-binding protein